jgi:hypothetical protein
MACATALQKQQHAGPSAIAERGESLGKAQPCIQGVLRECTSEPRMSAFALGGA